MAKLAWGARVSAEFRRKVIALAAEHGCDPSWFMAAMAFETGETFRADIVNSMSGATGLIQFMPRTAIGLGTTVEALARKTPEEQLDDVARYFAPFKGRLRSLSDVYMAILWPRGVGQPDDYVLIQNDDGRAYLQNKGLDINADGNITKGEATAHVQRRLLRGMEPENVYEDAAAPIEDRSTEYVPPEKEGIMGGGIALALVQSLISGFAPLAQQKINTVLTKNGVESQVGTQLVNTILNTIQPELAKADPATQITAVAAAQKDPVVMAKVEQTTVDYLAGVAPFLDKIAAMETAARVASDDSFDRAAKRADTPDGWKLRWQQVTFTQRFLGYASIAIAALIAALTGCLALIPEAAVSAVLNVIGQLVIALVTTIGLLGATFRDQNGFSFGGTVDANAAAMGRSELEARRIQMAR